MVYSCLNTETYIDLLSVNEVWACFTITATLKSEYGLKKKKHDEVCMPVLCQMAF